MRSPEGSTRGLDDNQAGFGRLTPLLEIQEAKRVAMDTIQGRKDGSVRVPGPVTLVRPSGEEIRIEKESVGSLEGQAPV